jgi:hypothetical protein
MKFKDSVVVRMRISGSRLMSWGGGIIAWTLRGECHLHRGEK